MDSQIPQSRAQDLVAFEAAIWRWTNRDEVQAAGKLFSQRLFARRPSVNRVLISGSSVIIRRQSPSGRDESQEAEIDAEEVVLNEATGLRCTLDGDAIRGPELLFIKIMIRIRYAIWENEEVDTRTIFGALEDSIEGLLLDDVEDVFWCWKELRLGLFHAIGHALWWDTYHEEGAGSHQSIAMTESSSRETSNSSYIADPQAHDIPNRSATQAQQLGSEGPAAILKHCNGVVWHSNLVRGLIDESVGGSSR